jgi:phenylacetate-CoA ligase
MKLLQFLPRFREAERALATLAAREMLTRAELDSFQLDRCNALWERAIHFVPYYRLLRRTHRLPERFDSWEQFEATVPLLNKQEVRNAPQAFLSECADRGRWALTSGSTGTPMRIFCSLREHRAMLQAKYRFHALWGVDVFDRFAFIWGPTASRRSGTRKKYDQLIERCTDHLRNRLRISAYHLGDTDLQLAARQVHRFQPHCLYGFSQAMYLLARVTEQEGLDNSRLKLCILTAEPSPWRLREAIHCALRVPTTIEYGATECGLIAYEDREGLLRVREDFVRVETLAKGDGRFDIVLTVLSNASFPLIRYVIGDVSDAPLRRPQTGFACLQNVSGRNDDLLITATGRLIHPACVDAIFESGEYPDVRQFQVRQNRAGAVHVMLQRQTGRNGVGEARLCQELQELLEGFPVTVDVVSTLPRLAGGKHRAVTSERAGLAIDRD